MRNVAGSEFQICWWVKEKIQGSEREKMKKKGNRGLQIVEYVCKYRWNQCELLVDLCMLDFECTFGAVKRNTLSEVNKRSFY